jgi:hypothetical protein
MPEFHPGDPGPDLWILRTIDALPIADRLRATQVVLDAHAAILQLQLDVHKQLSGIVAGAITPRGEG